MSHVGMQIPLIQGFSASYFHIWHRSLGRQLGNSRWEVFEKGMKMHLMCHIKVCFATTYYYILLAEFIELPIKLYALELTMGFQ
jgi:hypothetical protein